MCICLFIGEKESNFSRTCTAKRSSSHAKALRESSKREEEEEEEEEEKKKTKTSSLCFS
jgi:hypothetical protein